MRWGAFGVYLLLLGVLGAVAGLWWASALGDSLRECEDLNAIREIQGVLEDVRVSLDECGPGPGRGQVVAAIGGVFALVGAGLAAAGSGQR